jgi:hypothetical protein
MQRICHWLAKNGRAVSHNSICIGYQTTGELILKADISIRPELKWLPDLQISLLLGILLADATNFTLANDFRLICDLIG